MLTAPFPSRDGPRALAAFADGSRGRSDGRALDVATGLGRNAIALADAGWRVDAIDVSRSQLERAREHAVSRPAAVEWILADVDSYAFPRQYTTS